MKAGEKPKRLNKTRQLEIIDERLGRSETTNDHAIQLLKLANKLTSRKRTQKPSKAKVIKPAETKQPEAPRQPAPVPSTYGETAEWDRKVDEIRAKNHAELKKNQESIKLPGTVTAEGKVAGAPIVVHRKNGTNAIPVPDIIDYR